MQTGTYISGLAHITLLGWVAVASVLPDQAPEPDVQVSQVALISQAEFAAIVSHAPSPSTEVTPPKLPAQNSETPTPPKADTQPNQTMATEPDDPQSTGVKPDVSDLAELPKTDVQSQAPNPFEQPTTDSQGATLIVPTATLADQDRSGQHQPDKLAEVDPAEAPAPKVDTEAAPKPSSDAQTADIKETATTPDANATDPVQDAVEKAPDQAATEIITEAKERPSTVAPTRSSRPRGRPAKLASQSAAARQPTGASDIEKALAAVQADQSASKSARETRSGPPLSRAEKDGLRVAVQKCWNVNPSSEAARVTVTVAVSLDTNGKPQSGTLKLLSNSEGSAGAVISAFDAARRAILRCGGSGFDLPEDKYDHWRNVEMTFNPDKMRIK